MAPGFLYLLTFLPSSSRGLRHLAYIQKTGIRFPQRAQIVFPIYKLKILYIVRKLLLFILLLFSFSLSAQDIVYDPQIGNKNYWRRIKVGEKEKILNTYFQNLGLISRSKVLMGAGILDGISPNVDYEIYPLDYDTIVFEFKTNSLLNLNFYRYEYDENRHFNFAGLRKANRGDDMFSGQYLFVCPISADAYVTIYKGIGSKRKEFLSFKGSEMDEEEYIYTDYDVPDEMTIKVINGQRQILHAIIKRYIIDENDFQSRVAIWPVPANTYLNIKILENSGIILRIYNLSGVLLLEKQVNEELITLDVSSYKSGNYILVFSDYNFGNILYSTKIVII